MLGLCFSFAVRKFGIADTLLPVVVVERPKDILPEITTKICVLFLFLFWLCILLPLYVDCCRTTKYQSVDQLLKTVVSAGNLQGYKKNNCHQV